MGWDDRQIAFLNLRSPQTASNLQTSPHIEINVVDPFSRKGFRFKGIADVLTQGTPYEEIATYCERHRLIDRHRICSVIVMEVRQIRPLISPAYEQGATEEEVRAGWIARFLQAIEQLRSGA
jgi:uncharacterized protein